MNIDFSKLPASLIPLCEIQPDALTDFSLDPGAGALEESVRALGVTHPIVLFRELDGKRYRVVCGHRRVRIAFGLKLGNIPARVLDGQPSRATCLRMNILDNMDHRSYSDIETGLILNKLAETGVEDNDLVNVFLPLLGLQPGRKLIEDFKKTSRFRPGLNSLLHEMNIPIRVFSVFFRWESADRDAAEKLLASLRPGVNKWRELLELADETGKRDNVTPAEILAHSDIKSIMADTEIPVGKKYDSICKLLREWRYPALSSLQKKFLLAQDKLSLDRRTKVRVGKYFENDEIKIELKFSSQEELLEQVEKLSRAASSPAMRDLIRVISGADR